MRYATLAFLLLTALVSISTKPRTSPVFDAYSTRIGIKAENERLKNYATVLRNYPQGRGLIVVYAADEKSAKSAKARGLRAYQFVKTHGVEPGRIVWRYEAACKDLILLYLLDPDRSIPDRDPNCMRAHKRPLSYAGNQIAQQ